MVDFDRDLKGGSLWKASVVALALHGSVIAAFALTASRPEWDGLNSISVDVIFQTEEKQLPPQSNLRPDTSHPPLSLCSGVASSLRKEVDAKRQVREAFKKPLNLFAQGTVASTSPSFLFNPPPSYPLEARRKRIQGVVLIKVSLTEAGIVDKATPLPPKIHPLLEEAALKAIRAWRFTPTTKMMELEVPIEFKLDA